MKHISLRQLRYFDALARQRHFGCAADACAISQPALSMQIKELEETLGAPLLDRTARQLSLTKLGEELAPRVDRILRSVDDLEDFARASRDHLVGRLRVGMIPTVAPYLLPKLVSDLGQSYPELDIHVLSELSAWSGARRAGWSGSCCTSRRWFVVRQARCASSMLTDIRGNGAARRRLHAVLP